MFTTSGAADRIDLGTVEVNACGLRFTLRRLLFLSGLLSKGSETVSVKDVGVGTCEDNPERVPDCCRSSELAVTAGWRGVRVTISREFSS